MKTNRIAFPTDEHYPFQDEKARAVALQIVRDFNPHIRISGSDGLDFYSVSKYDKDPFHLRKCGLQDEIDLWQAGQREWRDASPNATTIWIPGNHEERLPKYLMHNPHLYDLRALAFQNLLGFETLGIVEQREEVVFGDQLVIKHGDIVRKHSGYTARGELEGEHYSISTLTGHTHRGGTHFARTRQGVVQAHEGFCLCDLNPKYVRNPDWQQGILLATVGADFVNVEPVPFFRRRNAVAAIWRGKEYISE